jgi:hypothetical protein
MAVNDVRGFTVMSVTDTKRAIVHIWLGSMTKETWMSC